MHDFIWFYIYTYINNNMPKIVFACVIVLENHEKDKYHINLKGLIWSVLQNFTSGLGPNRKFEVWYRVFIKYCVFPLNDFSELCQILSKNFKKRTQYLWKPGFTTCCMCSKYTSVTYLLTPYVCLLVGRSVIIS